MMFSDVYSKNIYFMIFFETRPNECQVEFLVKHVLIAGKEMTSNHEKCSRKINIRLEQFL